MAQPKRFHFKLSGDLALLGEVQSVNPYSVPLCEAKPKWEKIANNLRESRLKLNVTDRSCRERATLLIDRHKQCEATSARASGVDEDEPDDLSKLLVGVSQLYDACPKKKKTGRGVLPAKRSLAQETQARALEKIDDERTSAEAEEEERFLHDLERAQSTDENPSTLDVLGMKDVNKVKKRKVEKRDGAEEQMIQYLEQKSTKDFEVKQEEVKARIAEAENRKFELQLQKERQDVELDEKKKLNGLIFKILEQNLAKTSDQP